MSVRGFLSATNTMLSGGGGLYTIGELETVIDDLDDAFDAGIVSQFAREHLAIGGCP